MESRYQRGPKRTGSETYCQVSGGGSARQLAGALPGSSDEDMNTRVESKTESSAVTPSMRRTAILGARWGAFAGIVEQLGAAGSTFVLARLLTPADFGVVAAATVAVGLFQVLTRLGFGAALVNRKTMDDRVASTTFWLALSVGLVASALAAAASPWLASAVGRPEVAPYVAVASVMIVIGQVSRVSGSLLLRRLRFKAVYMADIASIVAYSATAIVLAILTDLGPWVIIIGRVVSAVVGTLARLIAGGWYPKLTFELGSVREDLRFNLGSITNALVLFGSRNVDYWMLGQTSTSAALGSYYVAYVLPNILRQRMTWLADEILFPVLSRIRDEPDRIRNAYTEVLQLLAFLAFPALLGISLLSERIVLVFFGPQWLAAVAPLSIIAVAAAIETVTQVATTVFISQGKPGRSVLVNGSRFLALAAGLAVAAAVGGLESVAWAVFASTLLASVIAQHLLIQSIQAAWSLLPKTLLPILIPTALMLVVVATVENVLPTGTPSFLELAWSAAVGGICYFVIGLMLFRRKFKRLAQQVREFCSPRSVRSEGPDPVTM
jgi:O-antigen/teichoic acid export membrane protein